MLPLDNQQVEKCRKFQFSNFFLNLLCVWTTQCGHMKTSYKKKFTKLNLDFVVILKTLYL